MTSRNGVSYHIPIPCWYALELWKVPPLVPLFTSANSCSKHSSRYDNTSHNLLPFVCITQNKRLFMAVPSSPCKFLRRTISLHFHNETLVVIYRNIYVLKRQLSLYYIKSYSYLDHTFVNTPTPPKYYHNSHPLWCIHNYHAVTNGYLCSHSYNRQIMTHL